MGVRHLWDILESCKKTLPLHHLQNKRICIDLSCWIVQLQTAAKLHPSDKLYLRNLFHRLRALIALNCSLIFVTDGSIPAIKLSTYRRRLNPGSEAGRDETMLNKVSSLTRNKGSEFSCMIKEAKVLGMALGIPCLDSIEEAEAQCALLNAEGLCDGCLSSDSDGFLFGARTIFRDICLGDGGYVVCYEMTDIERKLGFGRNSLITLALLIGSDYSPGVHGIGPDSACQIVKSVSDDVVLTRVVSEGISFARKLKGSREKGQAFKYKENSSDSEISNGGGQNLQRNCQFLQVADAYLKPKCHLSDSDAVRRVCVPHPFQRAKLQQICAQFFDWPPKITDEYILPKIAERDLRRFANLRSTSSELGVQLPLHKIPVRCPVSNIIKRRKVQGVDSFEVSWVEFDELRSSVVPADLIERACPEKIAEFEERKAEGKKRNHRKPKSKLENHASMAEVDQKLQELLLDINSKSNSSCVSSALGATASSAPRIDVASQEPVLVSEPESAATDGGGQDRSLNGPRTENVVIDLSSPSPLWARARNASKFRPSDRPPVVDVIDLSDSETDASPDHNRKARELRLFLAGIRDSLNDPNDL